MSRRMDPNAAVSDSDATPAPSGSSKSGWFHLGVAIAVLALVGVPVAMAGRMLWTELEALRADEAAAADSVVVGYPNISPLISSADKPNPWLRVEGETVLIWAGWTGSRGHQWFRARVGDVDPKAVGDPVGRDVTRAIDDPAVENGDGPIWRRIPDRARVVGVAVDGCSCAYPMAVLSKVLIVNDVIEGRPYVVHHDPFAHSGVVSVYDARLDGHRITLGSSGLTMRGRHVLYDRGTESLWADDGQGLTAFAGKFKGRRLPAVVRAEAVPWDDWRDSHPSARLLVGSLERKTVLPAE